MGLTLMIVGFCWAALGVVTMGSAAGVPVPVASAVFDSAVLMYVLPGLALAGLGRLVQIAGTAFAALKVFIEEKAKAEGAGEVLLNPAASPTPDPER